MVNDPRGQGRRRIFAEIRKADRIARVDIARETGISQATVTAITAELIREGLIEETHRSVESDTRRGRPRVDLKVRGSARIVAGVKLADAAASIVFLDFEGTLLGEHVVQLPRMVYAVEDLISDLRLALTDAAAIAGLTMTDIAGVGIGLAGFVDVERGVVHWSPVLTERNVALREQMCRGFGLPVFLDNDANLVAMAELYFGHGRTLRNFIVVTVETGVGAGIVLNGELFRGTRGCGAEFGHTKVQLDGALCRCGQRGCLEAYVADYALLREASIRPDFADPDDSHNKIQRLMRAARQGDPMARTITDRAARMFGMGLANLINIFDPELIILSGERMQFDFLYSEDVISSIHRQIVQIDAMPPEIVVHKWGDMMWAKGAAAYAIDGVAELALGGRGDTAA